MALENANVIEKNIAELYKIQIDYTDLNKFKYFANKNNINILKEEYLINIELEIALLDEKILDKNEINIKKKEFIKKIFV